MFFSSYPADFSPLFALLVVWVLCLPVPFLSSPRFFLFVDHWLIWWVWVLHHFLPWRGVECLSDFWAWGCMGHLLATFVSGILLLICLYAFDVVTFGALSSYHHLSLFFSSSWTSILSSALCTFLFLGISLRIFRFFPWMYYFWVVGAGFLPLMWCALFDSLGWSRVWVFFPYAFSFLTIILTRFFLLCSWRVPFGLVWLYLWILEARFGSWRMLFFLIFVSLLLPPIFVKFEYLFEFRRY